MRVLLGACLIIAVSAGGTVWGANESAANAAPVFRQYCLQCHGKTATAGVNLEHLISRSMGDNFQRWEKVAAALEQKRMPPEKMPQPSDGERRQAVAWVRAKLDDFARKHAGDPGAVTMRRLTSAEYAYTIRDLTGLDLDVERNFASDAAGGEGFTNFGDVQFMQDADLERYLEAAKNVAAHAVIGSGPIGFFDDPGKSGLELSAISRIQKIYRAHGFRAAAGEGGRPYGLDRYAKAFHASWRYLHREALGEDTATLEDLAAREGISPQFIRHIWSVLQQPLPSYPTSEVVSRWQSLPAPVGPDSQKIAAAVRAGCEDIQRFLIDWPRWLFAAGAMAAGGQGDERALVLTDASLQPTVTHRFRFPLRTRGQPKARVHLSVVSANPNSKEKTVVVWRNATVRIRGTDRSSGPAQPLKSLLDEETAKKLAFGQHPDGRAIDPEDFATVSDSPLFFDLPAPKGAGGMELQVEVGMGSGQSGDAVLRCTISGREEVSEGRPVWALLADPKSSGFQAWKTGVLEFAARMPQTSHGEPTPSDKDPIPAPFDNTYNQPERDHYHTALKYYRQDRFLVENMLDDATRLRLDQAWADLLGSFEYHDVFLRFVAEKYKLDLKNKGIGELDVAQIEALPAEPRQLVKDLRAEYDAVLKAQNAGRPGHVGDCILFAGKAWRRALLESEKEKLRSFYTKARQEHKLGHPEAVRSLLARILVAPAFLYRLEQPAKVAEVRELSDWEMASRLSYFLWSSLPDDELRRAADAGELSNPQQIERQVKRMLADPKARRLSTEFFGQWLGFYRFDQYRGVDTGRFPEFTDEVKSAMYDEAVSFFEHIVRKDRPVREILFADYTFLNQALAKHYGVQKEIKSDEAELVSGANEFQRGGLLRLGAVLTATSAPLRTSPVKRGDWVLRRVLGTPTPPPPADAGSIPADEKAFGGLTVRERLAAHQRNASCANCHSRIDPLGFPLERYDAVGRWRNEYSDGKPIHDSSDLADGTPISGLDGLLRYLKAQERQVLRTLSSKLLGYALGRTILASDRPLIERLTDAGADASFSKLAAEIATSRQFRYRREPAVKSSETEGEL
ncbi:MAG: DUF1592 domain-containing protein [Bryobacteraceae bacterium]